ncbi:polyphosphate polymerase domain-containing protein [Jeotgalibacillus proteolyticus]|uniref:VTC domain-containing protein n=1 Tax=Jeotgalibacillus proteolyticus TaxID=2082395 RepID=A0A2S5GB60_9BACL|nr:polyphosphate polymerase domain-containing protein [Jeotgalibacillus proteolyticus]PPA70267.1 VTC domain-containing protein [Jeotgalibacillus proteolyticus]
MAQEIFKRYEIKYLIPFKQYLSLREKLLPYMTFDTYGNPEGKYNIVSLYYDSDDYSIYYETRNKLRFRQKLRLRIYDQADLNSTAFFEIKQKFKNVVNKRRTSIPLNEAYALSDLDYDDIDFAAFNASNPQILKEAMHFKQLYQLKPEVVVSYDRQAFSGIYEKDLRVTFDYNLMCRNHDLSIENGPQGLNFVDPGMVVLEVKVSETVPFWLARLLSEFDCSKQSVSKFCTSIDLMLEEEQRKNKQIN